MPSPGGGLRGQIVQPSVRLRRRLRVKIAKQRGRRSRGLGRVGGALLPNTRPNALRDIHTSLTKPSTKSNIHLPNAVADDPTRARR